MLKVGARRRPSTSALARFGETRFARTTCFNAKALDGSAALFSLSSIRGCTRNLAIPGARGLILDGLRLPQPARASFGETVCVLARTI